MTLKLSWVSSLVSQAFAYQLPGTLIDVLEAYLKMQSSALLATHQAMDITQTVESWRIRASIRFAPAICDDDRRYSKKDAPDTIGLLQPTALAVLDAITPADTAFLGMITTRVMVCMHCLSRALLLFQLFPSVDLNLDISDSPLP
nr:hypothetical protein CFP56_54470 [Quercus suber]